jgi:hypothetical protein
MGACSSFTSDIGVDDEVGDAGSVVFEVYGDNVKLYDSGVMKGDTATRNVQVDLSHRNLLTLVVSDAGDGPAFDHADWAGAQVTCSR